MQCNAYIFFIWLFLPDSTGSILKWMEENELQIVNSELLYVSRPSVNVYFTTAFSFAFLNNTWVSNLILTPCKRASLGESPSFQIRKLFKIFVYLYRQIKSSFFPLKPEFFLEILTRRLLAINSKKQICVIFKKICSFVHL